MDHMIAWIESFVIVWVFLCTLFCYTLKNSKPHYINSITILQVLLLLAIPCEIAWLIWDGNTKMNAGNTFANMMYLILVSLYGYFWLMYTYDVIDSSVTNKTSTRLISAIPAASSVIMIIASLWTKQVFYIDSTGHYQRGPLFIFQLTPFLYQASATVLAFIHWRRAELSIMKSKFFSLIMLAVPLAVLCAVQMAFLPSGLPTVEFAMTLSMLLLFINQQERKITLDALTNLPNRYALDSMLSDKVKHADGGKTLYVIMSDIDSFKAINDTYGHMEGDRALIIVANIMTEVCREFGARPTRMGGDEYVIVGESNNRNDPETIIDLINSALRYADMEEEFHLALSSGYAIYEQPMTITQFLEKADHGLYEEKARKKRIYEEAISD